MKASQDGWNGEKRMEPREEGREVTFMDTIGMRGFYPGSKGNYGTVGNTV